MRAFGYFVLALLILFAIAAAGVWAFAWSWDDGRGPQFAWGGALSALVAAGILASLRQNASTTIFSLLAWAGAFLILILAYSYRDEARTMWARVRGEFFGGEAVVNSAGDVELRRMENGHFYSDAQINGTQVNLLVDTGAYAISLSWSDARAVGIDPSTLVFDQEIMTASGISKVARIHLAKVQIGPITRLDLEAAVLPATVEGSVLGMNFLNTLSSYQISGDRLTLRD